MRIRVAGKGWASWKISHCPVIQAFVVLANNKVAAAAACVRKYLVAASTARGWWCWAIRGIIARVLISSPIQARSQWELAKVMVVPSPRAMVRMDRIYGFISKRRSLTYIFGVWAQQLG